MNKSITLYYLYCLNAQCKNSIYHGMKELRIPLTIENLVKTHQCKCCKHLLSSSLDMEIRHTMTEINSKKTRKNSYMLN